MLKMWSIFISGYKNKGWFLVSEKSVVYINVNENQGAIIYKCDVNIVFGKQS